MRIKTLRRSRSAKRGSLCRPEPRAFTSRDAFSSVKSASCAGPPRQSATASFALTDAVGMTINAVLPSPTTSGGLRWPPYVVSGILMERKYRTPTSELDAQFGGGRVTHVDHLTRPPMSVRRRPERDEQAGRSIFISVVRGSGIAWAGRIALFPCSKRCCGSHIPIDRKFVGTEHAEARMRPQPPLDNATPRARSCCRAASRSLKTNGKCSGNAIAS